MEDNRSGLGKAIGRTDVISIGFGTIVGWSWVLLGASWVTGAGYLGALLAFVIGGIIVLAIGMMYGELTSALPLAGGIFVFAYRAFGKKIAFAAGWIMVLAYLGVAAWEGIALSTAMEYLFPFPKIILLWEVAGYQVYLSWAAIGIAGAIIMTICSIVGVRTGMMFQVMASGAIFIVVLFFFFGSISFGSVENLGSPFTSPKGFFYVLMMIPAMLIGFDVIPQSAEDLNIDAKDIGRMIVVCIILSVAWYCILIGGVALGAPEEIRCSGVLPVAGAAEYLFGSNAFGKIIVIGGILGILTTWNGFFMGATRLLMAMGRAHMIPSIFAKTGKRGKVPVASSILVGLICVVAVLLGENALIWLVDTSSVCSIASYVILSITFLALRKTEPQLQRPYQLKHGMVLGVLAFIVSAWYFIIFIFDTFSGGENQGLLAVLFTWATLGVIMYLATWKSRLVTDSKEMERHIFGRKFARDLKEGKERGGTI